MTTDEGTLKYGAYCSTVRLLEIETGYFTMFIYVYEFSILMNSNNSVSYHVSLKI